MSLKCVFTQDRYILYVFSDFTLRPLQEVLRIISFLIFHHHNKDVVQMGKIEGEAIEALPVSEVIQSK